MMNILIEVLKIICKILRKKSKELAPFSFRLGGRVEALSWAKAFLT
jgi:hypothetical protein